MATLGPESARPPPLAQLVSGIQAPLGNLPPSRGLERALEEAEASGSLSLSARKLKEFPRTANNHDLADTVEAGTAALMRYNRGETVVLGRQRLSAAWSQ
ncbi:hypothetical protein PBY51_022054 [Eleginops maclovinus]|uniref:Uncharacterized protein n=1 Tax=Eleginops maclovinus TaxID=56733 RepID=A0AAN7XJ40_ELEMC|nr:hypothetical protein PBY51_022054 [Eleginops maclovinus]